MLAVVLALCIIHGANHDRLQCDLLATEPVKTEVCDAVARTDEVVLLAREFYKDRSDGVMPVIIAESACVDSPENAILKAQELANSVEQKVIKFEGERAKLKKKGTPL